MCVCVLHEYTWVERIALGFVRVAGSAAHLPPAVDPTHASRHRRQLQKQIVGSLQE